MLINTHRNAWFLLSFEITGGKTTSCTRYYTAWSRDRKTALRRYTLYPVTLSRDVVYNDLTFGGKSAWPVSDGKARRVVRTRPVLRSERRGAREEMILKTPSILSRITGL